MRVHRNEAPAFVPNTNPLRIRRFKEVLEHAFSHLNRKPGHLYSVRQEKTPPIFERHLAEYVTLLRAGADLNHLLNGIEALMIELENERTDTVPRPAFISVEDAYDAEVKAEGNAQHLQLVACRTQSPADLDRAIEATDEEARVTRRLARELRRRRDTLRLMAAHVHPMRA